tara:strand:- start:1607 stop:1831 length:225 start_codon:yes stop_codon:yes gene_type:complete
MSLSENSDSYTTKAPNTIKDTVVKKLCSKLEKQKNDILQSQNLEKSWVKISNGVSVKLRKNTPVMESTFRLDNT